MISSKYSILVCLVGVVWLAAASSGDYDINYVRCTNECYQDCPNSRQPPISDWKLVHWDCHDTCNYNCMTEITRYRQSRGFGVLKYYGHWPFSRYFGMEEPASVVFSALNFISHFIYVSKCILGYFRGQKGQKYNYMSLSIFTYALCACNAWVASTLFHSKKTEAATQYDYVSALVFLSCGLWAAVRRFLGSGVPSAVAWSGSVAAAGAVGYRVASMIEGRVSFDSHMKLCIGIVIVTTVVWILWCTNPGNHVTAKQRWICVGCQLWLVAASALEIFDFPPYWDVFDAHSLWHAATIPLGFVWYGHFWRLDSELVVSKRDD